jgi:hypothetical protein
VHDEQMFLPKPDTNSALDIQLVQTIPFAHYIIDETDPEVQG